MSLPLSDHSLTLPLRFPAGPNMVWFSARGCLVLHADRCEVFVGGTLIGSFAPRDSATRNALLAGLACDLHVNRSALAAAFDVSTETVRKLGKVYDTGGVAAIVARRPPGRPTKLTPRILVRLEKAFANGLSVSDAHEECGGSLGRSTVGLVRQQWQGRQPQGCDASADEAAVAAPDQAPALLALSSSSDGLARDAGSIDSCASGAAVGAMESAPALLTAQVETSASAGDRERVGDVGVASEGTCVSASAVPIGATESAPTLLAVQDEAGASESAGDRERAGDVGAASEGTCTPAPTESAPQGDAASRTGSWGSPDEPGGADLRLGPRPPMSARGVQHLGAWLMIAVLAHMGLYRLAEAMRPAELSASALRIAFDALVAALSIGQRVVEGVRRLATPSASALFRARRAPSATWVRRQLGLLAADHRGERFHATMGLELARASHASDPEGPSVFYIDGHLRPYTGQEVVRKGWRMQDRRVRPGISDYYVHDEDGRPLMRVDVAAHDSLTTWLTPIADTLRDGLGPQANIVLAFDRGGAFPEQMVDLRDRGFDFVTYERAPYRTLPASAFKDTFTDAFGETVAWNEEHRRNLNAGRGRVRCVPFRMADGHQVNVLAISVLEPERLYEIVRGRWAQENSFKHGVARWGINQLDGRTTAAYPPGTIIPSPERRRLDEAIRIERAREGRARRQLARQEPGHAHRALWEAELAEALALQAEFESFRPAFPVHAPVEETELAGKLVQHPGEYKSLIDAVRVAAANAEADLAYILGEHLKRPAEGKRVLQNLMQAPGAIRVDEGQITVSLEPAGTENEISALRRFLQECTALRLSLPDDPRSRPVRWELQE